MESSESPRMIERPDPRPDALRLVKIRQTFPRPVLTDLEGRLRASIDAASPAIRPGMRIAIAVGSRGVANLERIVRTAVECVRERGGEPFIVPAMGSHGGGTAVGQEAVLAGYGITAERAGCPVRSSMEVVELPGGGGAEYRVLMDRLAAESDGVVLINRVKPHTDFHSRYESGLVKMMVIGLGKAAQAAEIHRHGVRGLVELVPRVAAELVGSGRIVLGIAAVENAYDETLLVEAIEPGRILEREPELLDLARVNMPRLPVDRMDVLIVDRMGKDISGVGMDTNIIGRIRIRGQPEPDRPEIGTIVVTDLTDASHGNATGMGLADVTTRRLFSKIDLRDTNTNVVTSGFLERARMPMVADTDRQAVEWALRGCGPLQGAEPRIVRIRDTLHLDEAYVSRPVLEEVTRVPGVEVLGTPSECFDARGNLREF